MLKCQKKDIKEFVKNVEYFLLGTTILDIVQNVRKKSAVKIRKNIKKPKKKGLIYARHVEKKYH